MSAFIRCRSVGRLGLGLGFEGGDGGLVEQAAGDADAS